MWTFRCSNGARWPNLGSREVRWSPLASVGMAGKPRSGARPVLAPSVTRRSYPRPNLPGVLGIGFLARWSYWPGIPTVKSGWHPLADVLRRAADGDITDIPGCITLPEPRQRPPQTRQLSAEQVEAILGQYQAGTGPRELAKTYGVTERAIKWLL